MRQAASASANVKNPSGGVGQGDPAAFMTFGTPIALHSNGLFLEMKRAYGVLGKPSKREA